LLLAAGGVLLLGKADPKIFDRARMVVTDAFAPILDALSRPIATGAAIVDEVQYLVHLREENATLRAELTDRLVPSHAYVQKAKAGQHLLKQQSRLLLAGDQAQRTEDQRQQRLGELQKTIASPPPETRRAATAEAPFKVAYNNYRDDHDYFRELSQSSGVLRWTGTEIEVHLVPTVNYAPKLRKIIDRLLQDLNAGELTLPDGSGRKLRLRLTRKEQIEVRVRDLDES